jgi:hypothetical protein
MDTNIASVAPSENGITESDLCRWLGAAFPGDQFAYHRGFLAVDCDPTAGRLSRRERARLLRLARRARLAAESGLAHLVQRRNGAGDFSYLLIARPRPNVPKCSLQTVLAEGVASCPTSVGTSIR